MNNKSAIRDPYDLLALDGAPEEESEEDKRRRLQQEDDLKWLMAHAAGRRIASRILEVTGVRRTSFNPSGSVMAFNEGRRNVGLWFEGNLLAVAPDGYFKLLKEYASE